MKTILARVTDTNQRALPARKIRVEFTQGLPKTVEHGGRKFTFTGKRGMNRRSGREVVELSTDGDARIWVTLDANELYEG